MGIPTISLSLAVMLAGCGVQAQSDGSNLVDATPAQIAAPINAADASSPDLSGANRLIDSIYAPYVRDEMDSDPSRTFTPELTAAIQAAGENAMDADPFCDCQDFDEFSYTIESVDRTDEGATARVSISNFGQSKIIPIRLAERGGTWMVADVGEGETSLMRMMTPASIRGTE